MTQRLRDTRTGTVVVVDDATAARLGSAYEKVAARRVSTGQDASGSAKRRKK